MVTKKQSTAAEAEKPAAKAAEGLIYVRQIRCRTVRIPLVGRTPLIMHNWSEKAKQAIRDKKSGKKPKGREPCNPEQEFLDALYFIGPKPKDFAEWKAKGPAAWRYGFPAVAFKAAIVDAASQTADVTKVMLRGALHIFSAPPQSKDCAAWRADLVEVQGEPVMREDPVRLMGTAADLRYRPEFVSWRVDLPVTYNEDVLTAEMVANLANLGGFAVGIGEWRAEKNGMNGMFAVATEAVA